MTVKIKVELYTGELFWTNPLEITDPDIVKSGSKVGAAKYILDNFTDSKWSMFQVGTEFRCIRTSDIKNLTFICL